MGDTLVVSSGELFSMICMDSVISGVIMSLIKDTSIFPKPLQIRSLFSLKLSGFPTHPHFLELDLDFIAPHLQHIHLLLFSNHFQGSLLSIKSLIIFNLNLITRIKIILYQTFEILVNLFLFFLPSVIERVAK